MDLRSLRTRCEERLAGIIVPQPFSLSQFAEAVSAHRGRRLELIGLPPGMPITGVWISCQKDGRAWDEIWLDSTATPWHRDVIAVHEIAHMLCGHDPSNDPAPGELLRALMPNLAGDMIGRVLERCRDAYDSAEELEAEMTGSMILARAETGPPPGIADRNGPCVPRLSEALRHPVRHV